VINAAQCRWLYRLCTATRDISMQPLKKFKPCHFLILFLCLVFGCGKEDIAVTSLKAIYNYLPLDSIKKIDLNYTNAIDSGFIIPSAAETESGYFRFQFELSNTTGNTEEYIYKLYYQNESYCFPEGREGNYNPLSSENFYGSWELPGITTRIISLKAGETLTVVDSLRITGNPRNESKYYGISLSSELDPEQIREVAAGIESDPAWYNSIKTKARKENRTVAEQLELDALYVIKENSSRNKINQRWKRNPRTGKYRFYLLLINKKEVKKMPDFIKDISVKDINTFVNPIHWLRSNKGKKLKYLFLPFVETLQVSAHPDLGSGIYIDPLINPANKSKQFYSSLCGSGAALYKNAAFGQYFHSLPVPFNSPNIPVVKDLQSSGFTADDYRQYLHLYPKGKMIPYSNIATDCACETVKSDSINKKILIWNPGYRRNKMVKENVGVTSRHGFTYGTYTFKVKMPQLLNSNNQWNGLTNALWMLNHHNEEWNTRKNCNSEFGYIPKETSGEFAERKKTVPYSEIDFEIRKGSPVWPATSYGPSYKRPSDTLSKPEDIVVLCTNWDLACREPKFFSVGATPIKHNNNVHIIHRWTHWYQALSSKYMVADDELFGRNYYYFQIEWKPEEIIWRIGPELNKLYEVGYMNAEFSSIPDNQMLMIFTQEYHISDWWPESPFLQEYIPIPQKNIVGEILDVKIE
jgi:hypothetical protein